MLMKYYRFFAEMAEHNHLEVYMEDINEMLIYRDKNGKVIVDAIYKDETLWLTQKGMSKVFDCSTDNVSLHLKNIFKSNELDEKSVTEESSGTADDGKNYQTKILKNLDVKTGEEKGLNE